MEKARIFLSSASEGDDLSGAVSGLDDRRRRPEDTASIYETLALRGIRVESIRPGFLSCTFRVPPRLTDREGNLATGAIANLVDEVGGHVMQTDGVHAKVSVDMSISYISKAKLHDEMEITSRVLGHKGGYSGTQVLLKNKETGEVVAEGRHSLFGKFKSKI